MAHSPRYSIDGDPAFQRYMLLSSQQEVLRRRLSLQIPSSSPMAASSPEMQSLASSPSSSARPSYSSSWAGEHYQYSTSPIPTLPGVGHRHLVEDAHHEDSKAMYEINQQMKATLTELLNTSSVRSDEKYRAWIQERLMDAEHQIRRQRRRRSSMDREIAQSIAEHFEPRYSP